MGNVNALLNQRLKKNENTSKMAAMARQSVDGHLTSFSGVFGMTDLSDHEKAKIESILEQFALNSDISDDLNLLVSITSEVKAINNQAALLHGERIKRAQTILKNYKEGAFTAWLVAAYGNRQTPYNLLQYYEFCEAMPKSLRLQIETMPRQALYTLASREGSIEKKKLIVENYKGETKLELLTIIRDAFPLGEKDRRGINQGDAIIKLLKKISIEFKQKKISLTSSQRNEILGLISTIKQAL